MALGVWGRLGTGAWMLMKEEKGLFVQVVLLVRRGWSEAALEYENFYKVLVPIVFMKLLSCVAWTLFSCFGMFYYRHYYRYCYYWLPCSLICLWHAL